MTNRLSTAAQRSQHPEIIPFDLHLEGAPESPDTLPLPGGPVGDDDLAGDATDGADDFDHDGDTMVDERNNRARPLGFHDDRDPDDRPPNSGAVGLPCKRGGVRPARLGYSLSVVRNDPLECEGYDDPAFGDIDGQELIRLHTRSMAMACADGFALQPHMLASRFQVDAEAAGYTHLVVNDCTGKELHRRPLLAAA